MTTAAVAPGWWEARVGGLPRPFWALWAGTLVNRLGAFVFPFLSLFLTGTRGYSIARAGLVLTVLGVGLGISQPLGGTLADRYGRRWTLVFGLVCSAASLLVVGAVRSFPALCVAVFVFGIFADLFRPASHAAIADLVPDELRVRAFALVFWALNVGFAVATLLGGVLAERGYWLLFAGDAATSLAFAGIILRSVPETRPDRVEATPGSLRDVLRDRLMIALVVSTVAQSMAYMQAFYTLPLAIVHDGLGTGGYGVVIALNGILIVALQPLLLGALGRRRRGALLLVAGIVIGVGLWLTTFADTVAEHMGAVTVWTLGEIVGAGVLGALVATIAPVHLRGRYMGVFGASYGASSILAPGLGTQVLQHLGEGALWTSCLVLAAGSGVGLLLVSRAADRR
jgi:predicted MFS family arabinose efflux permease